MIIKFNVDLWTTVIVDNLGSDKRFLFLGLNLTSSLLHS